MKRERHHVGSASKTGCTAPQKKKRLLSRNSFCHFVKNNITSRNRCNESKQLNKVREALSQ
jgi:hypothetical protein